MKPFIPWILLGLAVAMSLALMALKWRFDRLHKRTPLWCDGLAVAAVALVLASAVLGAAGVGS